MPFSLYLIKGACYQHVLSLMILTYRYGYSGLTTCRQFARFLQSKDIFSSLFIQHISQLILVIEPSFFFLPSQVLQVQLANNTLGHQEDRTKEHAQCKPLIVRTKVTRKHMILKVPVRFLLQLQ